MPIKTQSGLPAKEILERENVFVMEEGRASHQDIRPIRIAIVNLMPLKEETELQILRSMSNTPLQVEVSFIALSSHESTHTSLSHLNQFYQSFEEVQDEFFDGVIITGAPVEQMEYEEVDYWKKSARSWSGQRPMQPQPYICVGEHRLVFITIMEFQSANWTRKCSVYIPTIY